MLDQVQPGYRWPKWRNSTHARLVHRGIWRHCIHHLNLRGQRQGTYPHWFFFDFRIFPLLYNSRWSLSPNSATSNKKSRNSTDFGKLSSTMDTIVTSLSILPKIPFNWPRNASLNKALLPAGTAACSFSPVFRLQVHLWFPGDLFFLNIFAGIRCCNRSIGYSCDNLAQGFWP